MLLSQLIFVSSHVERHLPVTKDKTTKLMSMLSLSQESYSPESPRVIEKNISPN